MSNLVKFATEFGSSARLRAMSAEQLTEEMQRYQLTEQEQQAVLSQDAAALSKLENGNIYCLLFIEEPEDVTPEVEDLKQAV